MATDTITDATGSVLPAVRVLGALSLPAVGAIHLQEPGYDAAAIVASRIAEGAAVVFLATFLALRFVRRARSRR